MSVPNTNDDRQNRSQAAAHHVKIFVHQVFQHPSYAQAAQAYRSSVLLRSPQLLLPAQAHRRTQLIVRILEDDTFGAARQLLTQHPNSNEKIAVLNMANRRRRGGGFTDGHLAQEENLCMNSSLWYSLKAQFYTWREDEVIYSPDILVMKENNGSISGNLLPAKEWFYVSVISCAAVQTPTLATDQNGQFTYANINDRALMADKLRNIMRTAANHHVDRVILGALGCGAFGNPILEVANLMKDCLMGTNRQAPSDDWGEYGIKEVVIAIRDRQQGQPVLNGFLHVFYPPGSRVVPITNYQSNDVQGAHGYLVRDKTDRQFNDLQQAINRQQQQTNLAQQAATALWAASAARTAAAAAAAVAANNSSTAQQNVGNNGNGASTTREDDGDISMQSA